MIRTYLFSVMLPTIWWNWIASSLQRAIKSLSSAEKYVRIELYATFCNIWPCHGIILLIHVCLWLPMPSARSSSAPVKALHLLYWTSCVCPRPSVVNEDFPVLSSTFKSVSHVGLHSNINMYMYGFQNWGDMAFDISSTGCFWALTYHFSNHLVKFDNHVPGKDKVLSLSLSLSLSFSLSLFRLLSQAYLADKI